MINNNNDERIQDIILLLKIPEGRRKVLSENYRLRQVTSGNFDSPAVCIKGTARHPTTAALRQLLISTQEVFLSAQFSRVVSVPTLNPALSL